MYRGIIVLQLVSVSYVQGHYRTAVFVSAVCTGALLYCSRCQCSVYRGIILLQLSVRYVCGHYRSAVSVSVVCTGHYCTAVCTGTFLYCCVYQCGMYRAIILLLFVTVRYVQGHYCTAVCVSVVCTGSSFHCSVSVPYYMGIIVLQLSVRYLHGHYCTVVCASAVCTGALFYCSLCQCSMYRGIIVMPSVSVQCVQGHYGTAVISAICPVTFFIAVSHCCPIRALCVVACSTHSTCSYSNFLFSLLYCS